MGRASTPTTSRSQGASFRQACPSLVPLPHASGSAWSEQSSRGRPCPSPVTSARSRRSTLEDDPLRCLRRAARPDQRPHLPEIHWRLRQRLGLSEGETQGEELRAPPAKDPPLLREDRLFLLGTLAHVHTVGDRLPSYDLQRDWAPSPKGLDAAARHGGFALDLGRSGRSGGRAAALTVCGSRRCRALADRAVGHVRSSRLTTCVRLRFQPWPAQVLSPAPSGEASW